MKCCGLAHNDTEDFEIDGREMDKRSFSSSVRKSLKKRSEVSVTTRDQSRSSSVKRGKHNGYSPRDLKENLR